MNCQYDEDIQENVFFKELIANHTDLLEKCIKEKWIVCVPRKGTFSSSITVEDVLDHILIPDVQFNYTTLSKKEIIVKSKFIIPRNDDLCNNNVPVLFEEIFYSENGNKYTVWCIDRPLNVDYCRTVERINCLTNLIDCVDFLWSESLDGNVLEQIYVLCEDFFINNNDLVTRGLQTQKDLVGSLYSQCLQITLKNNSVLKKIGSNLQFMENLKLAVETCMQSYLNHKLFYAISTSTFQEDADFNKYVQNLADSEEINIGDLHTEIIFLAKNEFVKIKKHCTILGKISCLKDTFSVLCGDQCSKNCITADYLLQIFMYLIVKSHINTWIATLTYINEFRFSSLDISDQNSFLIATLEAAVQYIKNGYVTSNISSQNPNDIILNAIKSGKTENVDSLINLSSENVQLCHPLCVCKKCESATQNSNEVSLKNANGQSVLHIAVIHDKSDIVEYLLEKKVCDINDVDIYGNTALHWAAKKGFQDVLLQLIQSKADINIQNYEGNTPLHLAVNNNHENCVKAILYSSKFVNVNVINKCENTPLHLAAKWGYLNTVRILLENDASANVLNKFKQKPIDLVSNFYVYEALNKTEKKHNSKRKTVTFLDETNRTQSQSLKDDFGVRAKSIHSKKIELLLKAVENNDLPLTCFHLGIPNPVTQNFQSATCHPLCTCEKCKSSSESDQEISEKPQPKPAEHSNINVCNSDGYTALHIAAKFGHVKILRLLLDAGASLNLKTYKYLYTPLHLACMYQKTQVVRELLKCGGCNLDIQDARGNTPLFYACLKNDTKIFELLLAHGADTDIKNSNNVTVWQEAERKMLYNIVKLLNDNKNFSLVDDSDNDNDTF